jgi:hypothetical protein
MMSFSAVNVQTGAVSAAAPAAKTAGLNAARTVVRMVDGKLNPFEELGRGPQQRQDMGFGCSP